MRGRLTRCPSLSWPGLGPRPVQLWDRKVRTRGSQQTSLRWRPGEPGVPAPLRGPTFTCWVASRGWLACDISRDVSSNILLGVLSCLL